MVAAFSVVCSGVSLADWILLPLSSTLSSSSLLGHCVGKITKVLVEAKLVIGKFVGGSAAQTASLSQASASAQGLVGVVCRSELLSHSWRSLSGVS